MSSRTPETVAGARHGAHEQTAQSEVSVRCPLCEAEYPLREALALAPPALIVVADTAPGSLAAADHRFAAVPAAA